MGIAGCCYRCACSCFWFQLAQGAFFVAVSAILIGLANDDYYMYMKDPFAEAGQCQGDRVKSSSVAVPAIKDGFLDFPDDFAWGVATAAYQIEGAAAEGGKGPSIWDQIMSMPFIQAIAGTKGGGNIACDHYHRFRDDVKIMKQMGLKAYRLSLSWSRIIPDGDGKVNEEGVRFYSDLLDALKENDIDPWVTIYHWDLPTALNDRFRGWLGPKEEMVAAFGKYSRIVFELFGDRVKHWITLNEPFCMSMYYMLGFGVPNRVGGSRVDGYTATHNQLLCHAEAVRIYRSEFKAKQGGVIGITLNSDFFMPYNSSDEEHRKAADRGQEFQIGWFADPIYFGDYPHSMRLAVGDRLPKFTPHEMALLKNSSEFFGINNYFSAYAFPPPKSTVGNAVWKFGVRWTTMEGAYYADRNIMDRRDPRWDTVYTGQNWGITPWGLRDLLLYVQHRYQPAGGIAVTENGCAFEPPGARHLDTTPAALEPQPYRAGSSLGEDFATETFEDPERARWYRAHLAAVHAARAAGADVRAYFAWSFMDNLEWIGGYKIRFGIVRVDFQTQKRTIKASGRQYSRIIKEGGLMAPPRDEQ
eukprot:CAMPEP_0180698052 /NCGR_PEP_ID=MMETSP1038_2-20121128/3822_1 /TAXON_ID=632150 /ORGANISM="Azadinium spinosum, Strain 3D9" /LENGTH=583 /DNA_ID=CAMNT_0022729603 /DNA_START=37 /DNA_END=1785 /DNA_ORIENTATION=+